jgi:hypothetical protein
VTIKLYPRKGQLSKRVTNLVVHWDSGEIGKPFTQKAINAFAADVLKRGGDDQRNFSPGEPNND